MIQIKNINQQSKAGWVLVSKAEEKRLIKALRLTLKKRGLYADIKSTR